MSEAVLGTLLGGGAMRSTRTGEMAYHLGELDLDADEKKVDSLDLTFLAHGISRCPDRPDLFAMFEKHGPGACIADLSAGEVVHAIEAQGDNEFYGHGVWSGDGGILYCTETAVGDGYKGYIVVRDGRDYSILGEFPSFGLAPHDCMFTDDGATLVIANGGSALGYDKLRPSVAYVDVKSHKLLETLEVPNTQLNAGHLAMTSAGDLALVSAPRLGLDATRTCGGVTVRPSGSDMKSVAGPTNVLKQMLGETLSVAIHEPSRIVGATNPTGDIVTFWNLDTAELVKTLRVPNPRGIALSLCGSRFVINFGSPPRAAMVHAESFAVVDEPGNKRGFLSLATGSHVVIVGMAA